MQEIKEHGHDQQRVIDAIRALAKEVCDDLMKYVHCRAHGKEIANNLRAFGTCNSRLSTDDSKILSQLIDSVLGVRLEVDHYHKLVQSYIALEHLVDEDNDAEIDSAIYKEGLIEAGVSKAEMVNAIRGSDKQYIDARDHATDALDRHLAALQDQGVLFIAKIMDNIMSDSAVLSKYTKFNQEGIALDEVRKYLQDIVLQYDATKKHWKDDDIEAEILTVIQESTKSLIFDVRHYACDHINKKSERCVQNLLRVKRAVRSAIVEQTINVMPYYAPAVFFMPFGISAVFPHVLHKNLFLWRSCATFSIMLTTFYITKILLGLKVKMISRKASKLAVIGRIAVMYEVGLLLSDRLILAICGLSLVKVCVFKSVLAAACVGAQFLLPRYDGLVAGLEFPRINRMLSSGVLGGSVHCIRRYLSQAVESRACVAAFSTAGAYVAFSYFQSSAFSVTEKLMYKTYIHAALLGIAMAQKCNAIREATRAQKILCVAVHLGGLGVLSSLSRNANVMSCVTTAMLVSAVFSSEKDDFVPDVDEKRYCLIS